MNKVDFDTRAIVANLSQKEQLDFLSVFKQVEGRSFFSPLVDKQYLKDNGDRIAVAVRALLQPKLSKQSIDRIINVFNDLRK